MLFNPIDSPILFSTFHRRTMLLLNYAEGYRSNIML